MGKETSLMVPPSLTTAFLFWCQITGKRKKKERERERGREKKKEERKGKEREKERKELS